MRTILCLVALALFACSHVVHEFELTPLTQETEFPAQQKYDTVGHTHKPYTGKPRYLAAGGPMYPTNPSPSVAALNPCQIRTPACDDRLRAVLAAIDGHILSMATPPTAAQLQALRLSVNELLPLLMPYPDVGAEGEEMGQLLQELPTLPEIGQARARKRMIALTDLIRVQLAAAH